MISTEQAFDIIPQMCTIYEKVNVKAFIKDHKIKNKKTGKKALDEVDEDVEMVTVGLDLFAYILKQLPRVKKEVFEIMASLEGITVEKAKKQPLTKTLSTFKELFTNKELVDFFKQAMG